MKKIVHILIFTLLLSNTDCLVAQVEPEDVALDKNEFEESYYESLIQKGIENYDKAIISLEKCLKTQPDNAVIYHELGKNYFFKKDYSNAEASYLKATQFDNKNKWYLIGLYDVYYETKNYNQAVLIAQKIIPFDKKYRDDLVSLYIYTQQNDKALVLINELDQDVGNSEMRDRYKLEILSQNKKQLFGKNELEKAIDKTPLIEENYLSLIYLYSDNNEEEKARQIAEKLQKNIPTSDWAHVFLFKYHINENRAENASKSLDIVLNSNKIDKKIKFKMYNEFLIFVLKNPAYETQLNKATSYFENDSEFNVYKEVGKFYYKKNNWELAIKNLEKAKDTDLETNLFLLASYEEIKDFEKLQKTASNLIDIYPNQPEYYFFAGKASKELKKYKIAMDFLESGLEFVVENVNLEIDFLIQLTQTATATGNNKKAAEYSEKAKNLKKTKK
ncbi:cytochrome C biosynthesis protein [Flavobacterium sp.]|uniref:tetratricopeptide repeat protein n=1 Tax=Flavobacterium sp. TaxID=239 RepID=UPI00286CCCA8|nr:cytochrome C biosynthesis protein [Flavobacterium sp.]